MKSRKLKRYRITSKSWSKSRSGYWSYSRHRYWSYSWSESWSRFWFKTKSWIKSNINSRSWR